MCQLRLARRTAINATGACSRKKTCGEEMTQLKMRAMTIRSLSCSRTLGTAFALTMAAPFAGGCGGGGEDEGGQKAKLANELVTCNNEKSNLKEQLATAQAEIKKLKEAADTTVHL